MIRIIGDKLFDLLCEKLPGYLVRRLVKIEDVERDFEVDLASPTPVKIWQVNSAGVPQIELCLRITNKNAIRVVVDRILLEVWIGQPFIESAMLRRLSVESKQTLGYLCHRFYMSELQRATVNAQLDENLRLKQQLTIYATVFCDCKVGSFEFRRDFSIDRHGVAVN